MVVYNAWMGLPQNVRVGIRSTFTSIVLTANTLLGAAIAFAAAADPPAADTWEHFSSYIARHWFALLVALLYGGGTAGAFRAKQGVETNKTIQTLTLSNALMKGNAP